MIGPDMTMAEAREVAQHLIRIVLTRGSDEHEQAIMTMLGGMISEAINDDA